MNNSTTTGGTPLSQSPMIPWMMAGSLAGTVISATAVISTFFVYYPGWLRFLIWISLVPMPMIGAFIGGAMYEVCTWARRKTVAGLHMFCVWFLGLFIGRARARKWGNGSL